MKSLKTILLKIFFCSILVVVLSGVPLAHGENISSNNKTDLINEKSDSYSLTLVNDPSLTWNTFLGKNNGTDYGSSITADASGNIYVTGISNAAWGNPVRGYTGASDAFVAKLDSAGNLLWNTFLGGSVGNDNGEGIAVDGNGNIYVIGLTDVSSGNGTWGNPVRAFMGQGDAFVAKLDASGNLIWNTFLGSNAFDWGKGIAATVNGNIYVTGFSGDAWSGPTVRAYTAQDDAFVARLDSSGNLIWNSFLGGNGFDKGDGIALDVNGNLYVTGNTVGSVGSSSWGNPIRNYLGGDAFVARMDSTGNLIWNTFLGGSGSDDGKGVALDGTGNLYIIGSSNATWSSPVRNYIAGNETSIAKLDLSGNLMWNTFLGGNGDDYGYDIRIDDLGNIYGIGYSTASWGNPSRAFTAPEDAYIAKMDQNGNLMLNIFLGGNGHDYGYGISAQGNGIVYVTGSSTATWGSPIDAYTPPTDAFIAKLDLIVPPVITAVSSLPKTGFAPNRITSLPLQPASLAYADLGNIWLEIPSLNLKTTIVGVPQANTTWDVSWLGNNVGWLNGTAFPSWEGNSVITGHVYNSNGLPGPFVNLKDLNYGDQLIVHLGGEKYIFEISNSTLARPFVTKFAFEHLENHSYLTLITCQSYDEHSDSYRYRRIVRAVLVEVK